MAKAKKKLDKTYVHFVVDQSGSMANIGSTEVVNSINAFIETVAASGDVTFGITFFDSVEPQLHVRKVAKAKEAMLEAKEYNPRGATPLFDAIGQSISYIGSNVELEKDEIVSFVVMTDGHENTSQEFTKPLIKKLLDEKQQKHDWLVTYLGANQDGMAEGGSLGFAQKTSASWTVNNFGSTVAMAAGKTAEYSVMRGSASVNYTDQERSSMTKED